MNFEVNYCQKVSIPSIVYLGLVLRGRLARSSNHTCLILTYLYPTSSWRSVVATSFRLLYRALHRFSSNVHWIDACFSCCSVLCRFYYIFDLNYDLISMGFKNDQIQEREGGATKTELWTGRSNMFGGVSEELDVEK